jgi:hypothetical protein
MTASFELRHQLVCHLLFGLGDRTTHSQAGVAIKGYTTPEGATLVGFAIAPLSPLLPT